MLPFRVGQVARVTQLVTVVERAVFGGPHSGSRGCSPTGTHRGVEPVKRISPPAVTDSNDSQSLRTDTEGPNLWQQGHGAAHAVDRFARSHTGMIYSGDRRGRYGGHWPGTRNLADPFIKAGN